MTSVHGRLNRGCQSNYETSKHGLETLSDSLRLEMKKFDVKVIVIEPGMFGSCTSVQSKEMVSIDKKFTLSKLIVHDLNLSYIDYAYISINVYVLNNILTFILSNN